jgi:hypothetical protein
LFLKILSIILLIPGFSCAIFSKFIVKKFNLHEKVECDFEHQMKEEEILEYKFNRAEVNTKITGLLLALPGVILVLIAFK